MKILIIDKDELVLDFFKENLENYGHQSMILESINKASKIWEEYKPDVILCGGRNNYGDSLKFLKSVRLKNSTITFCLMSFFPPYPPELYLNEGANLFIDKTKGLNNTLNSFIELLNSITIKS